MSSPRLALVQDLAEQLRQLERQRLEHSRRGAADARRISLGIPAFDQLLPGQEQRGIGRGTLVEWLWTAEGSGAGTLALRAARRICAMEPVRDTIVEREKDQTAPSLHSPATDTMSVVQRERDQTALVVIDPCGEFYPPAAIACGIDLARLILVQPGNRPDRDWALDQTLRSAGVGAVWCWLDEADSRSLRRWQLAAEAGGAVGLLLRPESAREEPSFADVRLLVESAGLGLSLGKVGGPRRVRVEVLRARGTSGGGSVTLEIDDETGDVRLAAELADPTRERRATGS
jgi:protein ImuA